jgi:hypothetical protein
LATLFKGELLGSYNIVNDRLSGSIITVGIYIVVALMGLTLLGVLFNILAGLFPTIIPTSIGRAMPEPLTNLWNRYEMRIGDLGTEL